MDQVVKEVLKANRSLLVRNIIPCEEFFRKLAQQNIFPGSMLKDIKECSNQEQQNGQILDLLFLRGLAATHKFCDVLQLSGHAFLADFLREELTSSPVQGSARANDGGSLAQRFPKLDKILQDHHGYVDREDLAAYLDGKIQEEVVKKSWRQDTTEKEKAMVAKQKQLEEAWKYKEVIEQKSQKIQQLEDLTQKAREEVAEKEAEIRRMRKGADDLKDKHIKSMDSQIQFNLANDKSLRRLTEREIEMNSLLQELNNQMDGYLQRITPSQAPQRRDSVDLSTDVTPIMATKTKVTQTLELLWALESIKERYDALKEEHSLMLIHLGVDKTQEDSVSLLEVFRAFVVQNEQQITDLKENNAALEETLKGKDKDAEDIEQLRNELEETRLELMSKEMVVQNLQSEIRKLKVLLASREIKTKPSDLLPRPKSPTLPSRSQLSSARSIRSHLDEERSVPSRRSAKIETIVLDTSNGSSVKNPKPSKNSTITYGTLLDTPAQSFNLPPLRKAKAATNQSWSYTPTSSIPMRGQGGKQSLGKGIIINNPATGMTREQTLDQLGLPGGAGQKYYGMKSKPTKQAFQGPYQKQQSYELQRTHTMYQNR